MNVNKIIKVLVLFSLLIVLLPSTLAQANEKSVIGISTVYEDKRTTVDLAVFIETSEKVASGSFDVVYDGAALTTPKIVRGDLRDTYLSSENIQQDGLITVAWSAANGETLKGTLLNFTARTAKAGETVELKLENVQLYSEDGSKIAVQVLNGHIKPFSGDTTKHDSTVKGNKEWTITLSSDVNWATVNEHTVTVKRSGKAVDVVLEKGESDTIIVSPKNNYAAGTYTLELTEQVRSASGSKLNPPIRHEFTVK